MSENSSESFEEELFWCIEQLRIGLETQNPNSKQAIEATKVLKILLSSKAPLIKKRQAMRNTFGDYRKKMQDSERKSTAAVKKMKISSSGEKSYRKSHFYRKSSSKLQARTQSTVLETQSTETNDQSNNSLTQSSGLVASKSAESSGSGLVASKIDDLAENGLVSSKNASKEVDATELGFKFNFTISDDNVETDTACDNSSKELDGDKSTISNVSYFEKSDNSFRFNFSSPN